MEPIKLTYHVEGGDLISAGEASSKMKMALKKLDLPQETIRRAILHKPLHHAFGESCAAPNLEARTMSQIGG